MASSSNRRLACLIAIIAAVGPNASAETKPANRRAIAQVGNAVIIQQPDRLVIVQGGMRAAIHTRTLDGNGKSISFEVTIDADNDQDGAIVRIEDRKISCDGDASIELIPRQGSIPARGEKQADIDRDQALILSSNDAHIRASWRG